MFQDTQTPELLEINTIRSDIASFAKSYGGSCLVKTQGFDTEFNKLEHKKDLVSDWKTILLSEEKMPPVYFPKIDFIEKLSKDGVVLEGNNLSDAAIFINSAMLIKKFCITKYEELTLTGKLEIEASEIIDLSVYSNMILKEINEDGSVKDDHPQLKSARARIAALNGKINKISSKYMSGNSELWQSSLPSMKEGRIVLPLKSNFKGKVKGLIHEISQSGATVFIEPFDLVEINNEMIFEQNKLNHIVFDIYRRLTGSLRECVSQLEFTVNKVSFLDSWYARAAYSIKNNCLRPTSIERGIIIEKGRHPLLGKKAVPISITFAGDTNTLIITGPNAGGKTVTLKTCGLFILLNQLACEIPASEGTSLSIYKNVFADIGDEQSIEESLSTFSAHMLRIAGILKKADSNSLVLLDELGSGTDPSQGAAIAVGVLEYLRKRNISTIITSHHTAIKNFGYTRPGAKNASVAFDSETMKPSYKIIEGVPGESHAIEIAQQMGLPEELLKEVTLFLEDGNIEISEMIKELEQRQYEIIKKEKALYNEEKKIREERRIIDLQRLKIKQARHELNLKDYSRLKNFVSESGKRLENLVRELREGEITKEKTKKVKEQISELNNKLDYEKTRLQTEEEEISKLKNTEDDETKRNLKPGDEVEYIRNNKKGILIEKRKNNKWLVAFGNIKLTIYDKDLKLIKDKQIQKKGAFSFGSFSGRAVFELDLRGMRVYEAENALNKQIDSALLSGVDQFSIIHGLGDGILQKTVQDFLRDCNSVKSFSFSDPEAGGFGKTIVKLG